MSNTLMEIWPPQMRKKAKKMYVYLLELAPLNWQTFAIKISFFSLQWKTNLGPSTGATKSVLKGPISDS